ncbi:DUF3263 domain-containing protein [Salinifilum ghardaiensis]
MEAAQMLTAQRIARECRQLAGSAEAAQQQGGQQRDERGRRLRPVEALTEPLPRVAEPVPQEEPEVQPPAPEGELSERDRSVLAFERQWWKRGGAKERAIRELFDLTPTQYYRLLNALVDHPAARRYDPMLLKRLRRLRSGDQPARRTGSEWPR